MGLKDFSDDDIQALPLDLLALEVLRHFKATGEWNTADFPVDEWVRRKREGVQRVLFEAVSWLETNGLIAHPKPGQTHEQSMFITRAGEGALDGGLGPLRAAHRLDVDLDPRLQRVRTQFLIGEYELAAFAALREVEIRVRDLSGSQPSQIGVALMRAAFGANGSLADPHLDPGERTGIMELFAGAIGTFKNPPSHRQVNYEDPTEASEIILLADLLLRILDRAASRLGLA